MTTNENPSAELSDAKYGLRCEILRPPHDCSDNVCNGHDYVFLVGEFKDVYGELCRGHHQIPADGIRVRLVERKIFGRRHLHVVPVAPIEPWDSGDEILYPHYTDGGCYVDGDSRFPHWYPLSLHDRISYPLEYYYNKGKKEPKTDWSKLNDKLVTAVVRALKREHGNGGDWREVVQRKANESVNILRKDSMTPPDVLKKRHEYLSRWLTSIRHGERVDEFARS